MLPRYRIIISPEAAADLQAIHDYIAADSRDHAARMVGRILASIETLKGAPQRAVVEHTARRTAHPVRSTPVGRYVIYFRVMPPDQVVYILTIRHGARRPPRKFR